MNKISQKEAVLNTILAVLKRRGINYELSGKDPLAHFLSPEDKREVKSILFVAFRMGMISFKDPDKLKDDIYLKKYVCGLVSNWTKKATEFNCGEKDYYYIAA